MFDHGNSGGLDHLGPAVPVGRAVASVFMVEDSGLPVVEGAVVGVGYQFQKVGEGWTSPLEAIGTYRQLEVFLPLAIQFGAGSSQPTLHAVLEIESSSHILND